MQFSFFFLFFLVSMVLLMLNCSSVVYFMIYSELMLMFLIFFLCFFKGYWDISMIVYLAVLMVCEASMGLSLVVSLTLNSSELFSKLKWN